MKQITIQEIKEALNYGWNMTNNELASSIADILFQLANLKEKETGELAHRLSEIYRGEAMELCDKLDALGYFNSNQ